MITKKTIRKKHKTNLKFKSLRNKNNSKVNSNLLAISKTNLILNPNVLEASRKQFKHDFVKRKKFILPKSYLFIFKKAPKSRMGKGVGRYQFTRYLLTKGHLFFRSQTLLEGVVSNITFKKKLKSMLTKLPGKLRLIYDLR